MNEKEYELELMRIKLDESKHDKELLIKQKEIDIRIGEISKHTISPGFLTILIAVIGLLGTVFGAYIQGINNNELQQWKHDTEVVLKGLSLDSNEKRKEYLHFVANLGLLNNKSYSEKILAKETFPEGPSSVQNIMSRNNRAHTSLYTFLKWHFKNTDVSFKDVSQWDLSYIRKSSPSDPKDVIERKSKVAAELLDQGFIDLYGARYEPKIHTGMAINELSKMIASEGKSVSDLADLVDSLYQFSGE